MFTFTCAAQTYEVGAWLGGANYIGDVGRTNYVAPNTAAFGAIFKWNRSSRHSFRGTFMRSNIKASDLDASDSRRQQRGLNFENTLTELSIGLELSLIHI